MIQFVAHLELILLDTLWLCTDLLTLRNHKDFHSKLNSTLRG